MNILELCLSDDFGGLEIHFAQFNRWLADQPGFRLYLGQRAGSRIAEALRPLDAERFEVPSSCGKLPLWQARRLARFIEERKIDLVHLHWKFDLPLAALTKRICRRRFALVHTRHMNLPGRKFDPYHRFLYGSLDRLIVVTQYLARQAATQLPIDPSRIRTIHNGSAIPARVDAARIAEVKRKLGIEGRFVVGLLGRLSHYKGQHLLVEAVDALVGAGRDVSAWIVGEPFEPEYFEHLKSSVAARGLTDRVRFHGFYPQPQELYPCFDVVALTTRNETFGMVLVEAMHAGVAVVGSAEGGVPEIIDDGVNGLLFETFNSAALARAIGRLEAYPSFRAELAAAGRTKALRQFDHDTQYQRVLDELRSATCPTWLPTLPEDRRQAG